MCAECSNQTRCFAGASTVSNHAAATSEFTFRSWRPWKRISGTASLPIVVRSSEQLREQIGRGELIAFPDAADFCIAIRHIVTAIGHHAAIKTNPFALHVQVLDEDDLAGGGVGGDCLELAHRL